MTGRRGWERQEEGVGNDREEVLEMTATPKDNTGFDPR